ncbi:hypothetical protein LHJ74_00290 [Streptomyces sp. N2-109]|uniref:Secreted protein n=1 Tax=Streptomyces gossypii TaxID=2883101 RepID=A0ABT2JKJ4_9ACTN|nr:hypothetical protein [Streptomyces gossypii]MCT2588398.1 hypothetical protein [Streptomyces gossypii]
MTRIARTFLSLMALLGVAILTVPGTALAAPTADPAYNTKTQHLTSEPTSDMPESCIERSITLASGYYDWRIKGAAERPDLYLGAGRYTWKDCLIPGDGFYVQQSSLNPDNPDWDTILLTDYWFLAYSGSHQWGSSLLPHF